MPQIHPSKYYPDRKDVRLKGYDYSTHGNYFVTIVTQGRKELFGEVTDGSLISNAAGCMVNGVVEAMNAKYESQAFR